MIRALSSICLLGAVGCATAATGDAVTNPTAPTTDGYVDAMIPGVAVITADEAARRGLRGTPIDVAFADGTGPDDAIAQLLRSARDRGARHVGQVKLHVAAKDGDQDEACTITYVAREQVDESVTPATWVLITRQGMLVIGGQMRRAIGRWALAAGEPLCRTDAATNNHVSALVYDD